MTLIPVTRETLGHKRLKPQTSFAFAAKASLCGIVASEFAAIATNYPIFFIQQEGGFTPAAMLGLSGDDNLFVEADGGWSGGYVPGVFRSYPFFVQKDEAGAPILVVDDQCDLLSDSEGEPLFGTDEASDLASPVGRALHIITQMDLETVPTRALIAKIAETGIIQPINLAVDRSEAEKVVTGLHAINEASLNALPDETLVDLRRAGALLPIYAHLVSMGQVQQLKGRGRFRLALAAARNAQA